MSEYCWSAPVSFCDLPARVQLPVDASRCEPLIMSEPTMQGNIFDSIPDIIGEELTDVLVQRKDLKIERIVSRGHSAPETGWYDQDLDEWVMILQGEAMISLENQQEVYLAVGAYLNIPAHTKHKVQWTSPDTDTIWLAVHY